MTLIGANSFVPNGTRATYKPNLPVICFGTAGAASLVVCGGKAQPVWVAWALESGSRVTVLLDVCIAVLGVAGDRKVATAGMVCEFEVVTVGSVALEGLISGSVGATCVEAWVCTIGLVLARLSQLETINAMSKNMESCDRRVISSCILTFLIVFV
jgi:hypothetical protein